MKEFFKRYIHYFFLCTFSVALAVSPLSAKEQILLNMDVNQTLIATDTAGHKTLESVLSTLLSDKVCYRWTNQLDKPITYRAYIEEYVLPGSADDDAVLRKKRGEYLAQFVSFLKTTYHPLEKKVVSDYDFMKAKLETSFIFPSFLNLIVWLKEQEIPYTIILRTFGFDRDSVATAITQHFPDDSFFGSGKFKDETMFLKTQEQDCCFKNWDEIYQIFASAPAHLALQDDYALWDGHQRARAYGKKFFLDLKDVSTLSLFFDDHIVYSDGEKNIVDAVDVKTGEHLSIIELIEQKKIFPIDAHQAIMDDNYYINLVKQAL
jgi:hypothetical protein